MNTRRIVAATAAVLILGGGTMTAAQKPHRRNHLAGQKSPYLLQHADNPVDWYPWGEAAFEKARREDKPIFLSIGYATCHWCHVMEHQCFEDPEVAELMNRTFVNIKVDREERPDIDHVYMTVCRMLTGSGGWPLTIIMTPDRKPFFAATFIPKHSRFGRPGMMELVPRVAELWRSDRRRLLESASEIVGHLAAQSGVRAAGEPDPALIGRAARQLASRFDEAYGGFGDRPKFPSPHQLVFLLERARTERKPALRDMVIRTLDAMRDGGIYDQLGYGFHRYSTDRQWLVPHFEKMLYDQAMHLLALAEAYRDTGGIRFKETALEIVRYLDRRMTSPQGLFFSAEDADSEGEEGRFYLWTSAEIRTVLDPQEARAAFLVWDIEDEGNYGDEVTGEATGRNILHRAVGLDAAAAALDTTPDRVAHLLERARKKLLDVREQRPRPLLDDKVLTDWNGLTIAALARAGRLLEDPAVAARARRAEAAIRRTMRDGNGRLYHRWRDGELAVPAMLDDVACLAWGELELYETTLDPAYLERALALADRLRTEFQDAATGALYQTPREAEELLVRPRETADGAMPSGNSIAAWVLHRLGRLTGRDDLSAQFHKVLAASAHDLEDAPAAHTFLLWAWSQELEPPIHMVVVGPPEDPATVRLLKTARTSLPVSACVLRVDPSPEAPLRTMAPFLKNYRPVNGVPAAYLCRDFTCRLPVTDPGELRKLCVEAPAGAAPPSSENE